MAHLGLSFITLSCRILPVLEFAAEDIENEIGDSGFARAVLTSDDVDPVVELLIVGHAAAAENTETIEAEETGIRHKTALLRPVICRRVSVSAWSSVAEVRREKLDKANLVGGNRFRERGVKR